MTRLLPVFIFLAFSTIAFAEEKSRHEVLALEVVELMNDREAMATAAQQTFSPFLDQMRAQGLGEDKLKQISAAFDRYMAKVANDPALKKRLTKLYVETFTEKELAGLLEFYGTPLGKKLLDTFPEITSKSMQVGQELAVKHQAEFQQELQSILMQP